MHIALCDDHPVVADGIAQLLQALDANLKIERHTTAKSLLSAAPRWIDLDLVLLDLGLPDNEGLATLRRLRVIRDDVPVVVISAMTDRTTVLDVIEVGAMGFIPKSSSTERMLEAFKVVLDGNIYLPPDDVPIKQNAPQLNLTPRQWQILRRILEGKPIKRIATEFDIAECTVKTHITPILRELGVTNRTEAIVKAGAIGLRFPSERT
jgi:DNA-binding NarL/FixJ family response regulator